MHSLDAADVLKHVVELLAYFSACGICFVNYVLLINFYTVHGTYSKVSLVFY